MKLHYSEFDYLDASSARLLAKFKFRAQFDNMLLRIANEASKGHNNLSVTEEILEAETVDNLTERGFVVEIVTANPDSPEYLIQW